MPLNRFFKRPTPTLAVKNSAAGPLIAWSQIGRPKWTPRRYDTLAEESYRKNVIAWRN